MRSPLLLSLVLALGSGCSEAVPRDPGELGSGSLGSDDGFGSASSGSVDDDSGGESGAVDDDADVSSTGLPLPGTSTDGGEASTTGPDSPLDPPAGGSSGGSGGGKVDAELLQTPSGVYYRMIAPADPGPLPLLLVYSGTEGSQPMSINLLNFRGITGTQDFAFAVLHGVEYFGDPQAGIDVLEEVRARYDIDNDRMYLLSESAGTFAGLQLGLDLRQGWFAAYWANDINTAAVPARLADELGFRPWGNAGPGGQFALAETIVAGMESAGYRMDGPSPYDGPGAATHGDLEQLVAAVAWFKGKSRQ